MSGYHAVDLFAGAGGWDVAAERLGLNVLGYEFDEAANLTRAAAGFPTVEGDLSALDPTEQPQHGGQIASPPCQGFSMAGKGKGRDDSVLLLEHVAEVTTLDELVAAMDYLREHMTDDKTLLALEPLRWALATRPTWLAWEQVPAVLPIWQVCAEVLRRNGYSVATGKVSSEQFAVPQTRERAILVGRSAEYVALVGEVAMPVPTHSVYNRRKPEVLQPDLPKWVSMAEALGWGSADRVVSNYGSGGDPTNRGERTAEQPAASVTSKAGRNVVLRANAQPNSAVRDIEQPAPTITGGHDTGDRQWVERVNNQSGSDFDLDAQIARPATAVLGRELVPFGGANANRFNGATKSRNDGFRVSVDEAAALQTFPAGFPFQGNKGEQYQQVGNAIPCVLAEAVLSAAIGLTFTPPTYGPSVDDGGQATPRWLRNSSGHHDRPRDPETGRQIVREGDRDYYLRHDVTAPAPTITGSVSGMAWDSAVSDGGIGWLPGERPDQVSAETYVQTGQNSATDRDGGTRRYDRSTDAPAPTVTGQTRSWTITDTTTREKGTTVADIEFNDSKIKGTPDPKVLSAIVWLSLHVGLAKVTKANVGEWLGRAGLIEAISSPSIPELSDDGWAMRPLDRADVESCIGLTTSATAETRTAWSRRIVSVWFGDDVAGEVSGWDDEPEVAVDMSTKQQSDTEQTVEVLVGEGSSVVCPDPSNCDREHVGGMGGTPAHLPPDGVVVPGHFDHGVPSDAMPPVGDGSVVCLGCRAIVPAEAEGNRMLLCDGCLAIVRNEADRQQRVTEADPSPAIDPAVVAADAQQLAIDVPETTVQPLPPAPLLSVAALKARAKAASLTGYSSMKRDELVAALTEAGVDLA